MTGIPTGCLPFLIKFGLVLIQSHLALKGIYDKLS